MQIRSGIDENRSAIRSSKLFLSVGVTFAVVAVLVGVMMWFGQQHLGKLRAQVRPQEQPEQTDAKRIEASTSAVATNKKQAAVGHCRAVQGINAWLVCMEREGVDIRELLKTGQ